MPGIAGIISKKLPHKCENDMHLMIEPMMHESFYSSRTFQNNEMGVYAGSVSIEGSFSDCMPILNEERNLVLLLAGETFADAEVKLWLKRQGHVFDPSNASYLIHLYEEDEDRFFHQLNGWFSGIIIDLRRLKVTLFNDRYGMQRVYCCESDDEFLFASEAKSLLKIKRELRNFQMESLGEFFSCGCVLENRTLFRNISLLPGGSVWTFHGGKCITKSQYFTPDIWENQPILEEDVFYQELTKTFSRILPHYVDSTGPIAMSLTGGLDTRMIMACTDSSRSLPCYTFGGIYRDCLDVLIAREIAAACHQKYDVIRLDDDFFRNFSRYAEKTVYLTDGCHEVSGSHDIFLNNRAREIAPTRVTGKFGGEVLRGVANVKAASPSKELFSPDFFEHILKSDRTLDAVRKGRPISYSVFKGIPWGMHGCLSAEQSQVTLRSPYMDNDFVGLLYQSPPDLLFSNDISLRLIADDAPELAKIRTDRGFGGRQTFLLSRLRELFYFSLFKLDWYYGVGMPDWMIKLESKFGLSQLRKFLLGTQRIDHYRIWFQNELSGYVQEILLDKETMERPYINKHFLEKIVKNHIEGRSNHTKEINRALTVELIQRLLIENI